MSQGYLSLVLHAHLPFVRDPEDPTPRRDDWYLEALVECYLPLLASWNQLAGEGVPFRITLSISPTLLSMMTDPVIRERSRDHLDRLIDLGEREVERTRDLPGFHETARMYLDRFRRLRRFHLDEHGGDLLAAIRGLREAGRVEVITTAATHGFLPALRPVPEAVRAQIRIGLDLFESVFGERPPGFWLPECGYYPRLEEELEQEGIRYFITESVAILRARPRPKYGVHSAVFTPSGVAAFGRDPASSEQVWSSFLGYPGDYDYREFYRDIGYELDLGHLASHLPPDGSRKDTGFKYHRVTGPAEEKAPYVREWALEKAAIHAQHFLDGRRGQVEYLVKDCDRRPLLVAPFDAELFGHWWFEGPEWLEYLIRKAAYDQDTLELITPGDYLDRYPVNQAVELCPSTWGRNATSETWINGSNDFIWRHLHRGARRMREIAGSLTGPSKLFDRARRQAARELLLAQSSDWAFMMSDDNTRDYGRRRFEEHMLNFLGLERQIRSGPIDRAWLAGLERQNNLFPEINLAHFT